MAQIVTHGEFEFEPLTRQHPFIFTHLSKKEVGALDLKVKGKVLDSSLLFHLDDDFWLRS